MLQQYSLKKVGLRSYVFYFWLGRCRGSRGGVGEVGAVVCVQSVCIGMHVSCVSLRYAAAASFALTHRGAIEIL